MSSGILVICEHEGGAFKKTAQELLGKATELASEVGGAVNAAVVGSADGGASLGAFGAQGVFVAEGDGLDSGATCAHVRALQAIIEAVDPAVVIGPVSARTREVFPRLAARLGAGMITECTDLRAEGGAVIGRRPMYAGKAFADVKASGRALITVRPNSFQAPAAAGGAAAVQSVAVSLQPDDLVGSVIGTEAPTSNIVDLSEADRIVSGGRPTGSVERFDEVIRPLAAAFGATVGASRAAVDAGFASHSEQVGQTGKVVNPSLYVACAISGAIQHLAGMRTSRVIVAINKDPEAPIFQHATYGIVGDIFEVCPQLQIEAKAALS
jgi:electron transfer flavoprotein alpha subunit